MRDQLRRTLTDNFLILSIYMASDSPGALSSLLPGHFSGVPGFQILPLRLDLGPSRKPASHSFSGNPFA